MRDHSYKLSEDNGLGSYFEIQKLFLDIHETIGLDDYQANRDLLYKAIKAAQYREDRNRIECIAVFMMVEGREGLFYEGKISHRHPGSMGDVTIREISYPDLSQVLREVADEIQRATGIYLPDLEIFIQQDFFEKNIDEEFYEIVKDAFSHAMFDEEFFGDAHHHGEIMNIFEYEDKMRILELYKVNEIEARRSVFNSITEYYI